MKKRYIITESQLKLLEVDSIIPYSIFGILVCGGLYGLLSVIENEAKDLVSQRNLRKLFGDNSEEIVIELFEMNGQKEFEFDICELVDKKVKFELWDHREIKQVGEIFLIIKKATYKLEVEGKNKLDTKVVLECVNSEDENEEINVRLIPVSSGRSMWMVSSTSVIKFMSDYKKPILVGKNKNLFNFIVNKLKLPIEKLIYIPKKGIKTDF